MSDQNLGMNFNIPPGVGERLPTASVPFPDLGVLAQTESTAPDSMDQSVFVHDDYQEVITSTVDSNSSVINGSRVNFSDTGSVIVIKSHESSEPTQDPQDGSSTDSHIEEAVDISATELEDDTVISQSLGVLAVSSKADNDSGVHDLVLPTYRSIDTDAEKARFAQMDVDKKDKEIALEAQKIAEREATEQLIAEAKKARLHDILSNLEGISHAANRELRTVRVFNAEDMALGVGNLVAGLVVERAEGYRNQVNDPKYLTTLPMHPDYESLDDRPNSLAEYVAANTRGDTAGTAFLKTILTSKTRFVNGEIEKELFDRLLIRYVKQHRQIAKLVKQPKTEKLFENLTSQEAWDIMASTYVTIAREHSIQSHLDFFANIERDDKSDTGLKHHMPTDFRAMVTVGGFEKGADYQTVGEGAGEAAYIMVPIEDPQPLDDASIWTIHSKGQHNRLRLSENGLHHYLKDSVDTIIELAGGLNGAIANVGGYDQGSFMAIINASGDPSKTTSEYSGGYLLACYDPSNPAYNVGNKGAQPFVIERDTYFIPDEQQARSGTGVIKWAVRAWHLTDKGYSQVRTAIDTAMSDPDPVIVPFVDPRPQIRETYLDQAQKYQVRGGVTAALLRQRNETIKQYEAAARDIAAGIQPKNIPRTQTPQLDRKGLRSQHLPAFATGNSTGNKAI